MSEAIPLASVDPMKKARAGLDIAMGVAGLVLLGGHYLGQWELVGEGLAFGYGLVALVLPSFRQGGAQ